MKINFPLLTSMCCSLTGYEKYNTIRADPKLCFLERVGRPDEKAIAAEQRSNDFMDGWVQDNSLKPGNNLIISIYFWIHLELFFLNKIICAFFRDVDDPEYKPAPALLKEDMEVRPNK